MDYSLFYLSGILFTAINKKNDKYFKNLSYLYKVPVDGIYSEKSFFLTVLFLPIIYCNDACLCENKVPPNG